MLLKLMVVITSDYIHIVNCKKLFSVSCHVLVLKNCTL